MFSWSRATWAAATALVASSLAAAVLAADTGAAPSKTGPAGSILAHLPGQLNAAASMLVVTGYYALVAVNVGLALACIGLGGLVVVSANTPAARREWAAALASLWGYYRTLWYFVAGGSLRDCPYFQPDASAGPSEADADADPLMSEATLRQTRTHLFSLALVHRMWDQPHYRHGSFGEDARLNLRNVAIPGTGVPLSVFGLHVFLAWAAVAVVNPLACLVFAFYVARQKGDMAGAARAFRELLLAPQDWFSFWRLNCRLATHHAAITKDEGYALEDKFTFLEACAAAGVPVNPSLRCKGIIVKHRNEEGGLGLQSFSSASAGGDWIIQERIDNAPALAALLPADAPLSTLRVVTASTLGLSSEARRDASGDDIQALSCAFRAGRAGAVTDHSSIQFDVNVETGEVRRGTTSAHWYQLGLAKALSTPWTSEHDVTHHPDCGKPIAGVTIPDMAGIRKLVCDAHRRLLPRVPLVGWDVALTARHGVVLLEVNLSCNFFRARFDKTRYFRLVEQYFLDLERVQLEAEGGPGAASSAKTGGGGGAPAAANGRAPAAKTKST
ncbi:hypothetical protein FNF28_06264 [Cafeteria roenbergensis]|uniref:Alpha-L-glutamate ligase-related protein ATP-grasp domain-containing protein n=1 Tax=Cafeteria roenbergensis TaxID=33653 RepID=A0A5A8CYT5_CAFRO|nr:hypothetical protein FNF28_06264 [Cafeteria roenbergensis]